eukprot:m.113582 g.113582  ORF g.113582 m.113582 type:complete len:68 (+) comp13027_c0_seq1:1481-1684(+)
MGSPLSSSPRFKDQEPRTVATTAPTAGATRGLSCSALGMVKIAQRNGIDLHVGAIQHCLFVDSEPLL